MSFKPIANNNLYTEVINAIISAIATGELQSGEKIVEQTIANDMNISRAPIREAIRELSTQGILEYTPKKGATVAKLTKQTIMETYSLRGVLEGMALTLAIDHIDDEELKYLEKLSKAMTEDLEKQDIESFIGKDVEFHSFICKKSEHTKLQKLIDNFVLQTKLFMKMSKYNMLIRSTLSKEYGIHDEIVQCIREKNKEKAERAMRKHIINSGEVLVNYLMEREIV